MDIGIMINRDDAEKLLAQLILDNKATNWEGLERTEEAIRERARIIRWANGNNALEGIPPPVKGSFLDRLLQHLINGDISSEQSIEVLNARYKVTQDGTKT